jgi:hypothetical protein
MTTMYDYPEIGCHVDESAGSAEDLNLRVIDVAESYGFECDELPEEDDEDYEQILGEVADGAVDFLNGLETRTGCYWTINDNSLFLSVDVDSVREDVGFVSHPGNCRCAEHDPDDPAYPLAAYRGEWLHVNDHGNATLYSRTDDGDQEVWSIV